MCDLYEARLRESPEDFTLDSDDCVRLRPAVSRTTEAHLIRSDDAVALRPMTLEEAVKECEFRDRDVFVFRDKKGRVNVLHRRKDGKIELIEAP